jgi:hypothetical protein
MKKLLAIAILVGATGCSTVKQAQTDFQNFQRTIKWNASQPVVLKTAYF